MRRTERSQVYLAEVWGTVSQPRTMTLAHSEVMVLERSVAGRIRCLSSKHFIVLFWLLIDWIDRSHILLQLIATVNQSCLEVMWGGFGLWMSRFSPNDQGPEVFHIHLQLQGRDRSKLDCFASSSLMFESAVRGFTWEAQQGSWPMRRAASFNRPNSKLLGFSQSHVECLIFCLVGSTWTLSLKVSRCFKCQLRRLCQEYFEEEKTMKYRCPQGWTELA